MALPFRMLNFCRHRNLGSRSVSFQRPADNQMRVVVPGELPELTSVRLRVPFFLEDNPGFVELSFPVIRS